MNNQKIKKRFFAAHAKSSAAIVSLGIHAILIFVALSFVAVTVYIKPEQTFEAKEAKRPKMPLKKLQVPVNVKKASQKPKLRKTIVVKPKLNQNTPDIKMPEIAGVKGGLGGAAGGLGGGDGIGFSMPEVNIFGVKGKGEKIFIILDSSTWMMVDEMGGIPAYTIIKNELVKILGRLSPTTLFNIAVFDRGRSYVLFSQMVSANAANVSKVDAWLKPLNAVKAQMADDEYGVRTLGPGSHRITENFAIEPLKRVSQWCQPAMLAMKEEADAVFILAGNWGEHYHIDKPAKSWDASKRKRWEEKLAQAKQKLAEENEERRKKGQPPRVIGGPIGIINAYFSGVEHPPQPVRYWYTPKEVAEAMVATREKWKSQSPVISGLGKKKDKFSVNVILFVRTDTGARANDEGRFRQLTGYLDGEYRTIAGLEAIKSSVSKE